MGARGLSVFVDTFSILERIVVCATILSTHLGHNRVDFQYPRTDRGVCNSYGKIRSKRSIAAFSILERIVVCATIIGKNGCNNRP